MINLYQAYFDLKLRKINSMVTESNTQRLIDVIDETSSSRSQIILISGLSGTGKTALMSSLKSQSNNFYFLSLDSFGEQKDGKWILDVEGVEKFLTSHRSQTVVMEGVSDNMEAIASIVPIDKLIYLKPEVSLFRDINGAKYKETELSETPEAWRDHWLKMSTITDNRYDKLIQSKIELASRIKCKSFVTFEVNREGHVVRGWH